MPVVPMDGLLTASLTMTTVRMLTRQVTVAARVMSMAYSWVQASNTHVWLSVRAAMNLEQVSVPKGDWYVIKIGSLYLCLNRSFVL